MIDIHNHILPGVDDGPTTIQESVQMAKEAYAQGITKIVASPHHQNGIYINEREEILLQVTVLNELIEAHDIPVTVIPGQEVRIYNEMIKDLVGNKIQTINDSKYLLLEFPFDHVPNNTYDTISQLLQKNIIPIITHPERYKKIRENPHILYELISLGATAQLTASSLLGVFGNDVKKFSLELLEHDLVHFVASDAHNTTVRWFDLVEAYDTVEDLYGTELVDQLKENSMFVFEDEPIRKHEPKKLTRRRKLF